MWGLSSFAGATECVHDGIPVRVSESAISHLSKEDITATNLCDMIHHHVDCPKGRSGIPHRRSTLRLCAVRKGKMYSILMEREYTLDIRQDAYVVIHLEPI